MAAAEFEPIPFGVLRGRLQQYDSDRQKAQQAIFDKLQVALNEVRRAYLEQRFSDMIIGLV
ncbi:MAG: hypothetical protein AAGC55_23700, partial [Myxococcota bacterium]